MEYLRHEMGWDFGAGNCGPPVRRVVTWADLGLVAQSKDTYEPGFTLLHRCSSHTGLCTDLGETCGPTRTENVELVFKASISRQAFIFIHGMNIESFSPALGGIRNYVMIHNCNCAIIIIIIIIIIHMIFHVIIIHMLFHVFILFICYFMLLLFICYFTILLFISY